MADDENDEQPADLSGLYPARATVPGTDVELRGASFGDTMKRGKSVKSDAIDDREFAVRLLQQQATPEAADTIAAWSDDQLLGAVRFYVAELEELPDLDPAELDLATFRAAVVAEHQRRDEKWRELFDNIKLPTIDASGLAGIDFSQFAPKLNLTQDAIDALTKTNITFDQLQSALPRVSPDLFKGLTDTSAIDSAMRKAAEGFEPRYAEPFVPIKTAEDYRAEAQLDAIYEQTKLLRKQGAQTAILTEQVTGLRQDSATSWRKDRPLLWAAAVGAVLGAFLTGIGIWAAVNLPADPAPTPTPPPTPTAEVEP